MTNTMILILTLLIYLFLDGDVPSVPSYGVYISQIIRFARVSSHLAYFNARNKTLTAKHLKHGNNIIKFGKLFLLFLSSTLRQTWFLYMI